MKNELHIIALWSRARDKEQKILADIQTKFNVKEVFDVSWSQDNFLNNLERFYGIKLGTAEGKAKETGFGNILLCIIEDTNPTYEWMTTSRGSEIVNKNMFDAKQLYRSWTGGGHKIHATNSPQETLHDLTLFLGKTPEDFLKQAPSKWDGVVKQLNQDLVGANGWDSLEQLFYVLNATSNYAVLRNFEILPQNFNSTEHGDIDLLVEDYENTKLIMNAKSVFKESYRVHCTTKISNTDVYFDLRYLGDNYYNFSFEKQLLDNKILERGFFRPSDEDYFYSLVYHALIHKVKVADDYNIKTKALFEKLFDKKELNAKNKYQRFDIYYNKLLTYMAQKGLSFVKSNDKSVYFDQNIAFLEENIYKIQKRFDVSNLAPFYVSRKSGSGFFNYTANLGDKKVFIKIGGLADSSKREFVALEFLHSINAKYFAKPYFFRYDEQEKMFISSFEEGTNLKQIFQSDCNKYDFDKIAKQLKEIFDILQSQKIVHRDIKPDNFIVDANSNIKLLDFQFAISKELDALKETRELNNVLWMLKDLGEEYRYADYHWDDAFSFAKILEEINKIKPSKAIQDLANIIKEKVGLLSYKANNKSDAKRKKIGIPYVLEIIKEKHPDKKRYTIKFLGIKVLRFSKKKKK